MMSTEYGVQFNIERVSVETLGYFYTANCNKTPENMLKALREILADCLWDKRKLEYVNDIDFSRDYISKLTVVELSDLLDWLNKQMDIQMAFNEALRSSKNE